MAIAKVRLNGVTQMDVTGKTVTAASMLSGATALKNDGTDITGSISNMTLPSASSATSSGTSKATITPTSSAQYLNIPAGYNSAAQYYTIAAASGGASNIVTGTFKGTSDGSLDVALSYSGSGYPIAVMICPSGGISGNTTFANAIARYNIGLFVMSKSYINTSPQYDGTVAGGYDGADYLIRYKGSSSNSTSYSNTGGNNSGYYNTTSVTSSWASVIRVKSKTQMSVYIAPAGSDGFMKNIDYKYWVIYSS